MRRILGIDPGSRITGFAVIDSDGRRSQHVDSGCIRLDTGVPVPQRLGDLYQEVAAIAEAAIESSGTDYNVYVPIINALDSLGKKDA